MEILMGLALIALASGLFALNLNSLLSGFTEKRPEKIVYEAVREARYQAAFIGESIRLTFKDHALIIRKPSSKNVIKTFTFPDWIDISFDNIPIKKYEFGRFIIDKKIVQEKLKAITFNPDGSSNAAMITLKEDQDVIELQLDPTSVGLTLIDKNT